MFIFIIASLFVCILSEPVPEKKCPGGSSSGDTVETGMYWYTCHCDAGKCNLDMQGCLSEKKERLKAGGTYINNGYVIECIEEPKGEYRFKYKGCTSEDGKERPINDSWEDKNYWYECTSKNGAVSAEIRGCMDEGKRYNPGESFNKMDLIYECKRASDGNIGWNSYPNHAATVTYNPDQDRVHVQQNRPL